MSDEPKPEDEVPVLDQETPAEAKPSKKSRADKRKPAAQAAPEEEKAVSAPAEAREPGETSAEPATVVAAQVDRNGDLFQQGVQALLRGEYDAANSFFGQALTIYRTNRDQAGQVAVLEQLGHLCYLRGTEVQAREYYRQAGLMRNA
jgi:hypothetical protein